MSDTSVMMFGSVDKFFRFEASATFSVANSTVEAQTISTYEIDLKGVTGNDVFCISNGGFCWK
jgi:hypothetical protein